MTTNTLVPTQNPIVAALQGLFRSKDIIMALSLVILVGMLLIPLPPFLVDLAVALSIAASIGIVLLTMFIKQPMEFSVFPTVLLLITLFRLGINVSVSRLILLSGEAGQIINTFGNLIVGGNYVVGVVIFLILMIIQFVRFLLGRDIKALVQQKHIKNGKNQKCGLSAISQLLNKKLLSVLRQ